MARLEVPGDFVGIRFREINELFFAQLVGPALEDLKDLGTTFDLRGEEEMKRGEEKRLEEEM